jgi:enoyl-[acyl-carrier-protein] reductase (NADH)
VLCALVHVRHVTLDANTISNCGQVHSLANGPEVTKPLLETSRKGYLAAMSASSYSFVSMMQRFGPIMNPGGAAISLTYIASEDVIPGYGGGMSSAKAVSVTRLYIQSHLLHISVRAAGTVACRLRWWYEQHQGHECSVASSGYSSIQFA